MSDHTDADAIANTLDISHGVTAEGSGIMCVRFDVGDAEWASMLGAMFANIIRSTWDAAHEADEPDLEPPMPPFPSFDEFE